MAEGGSGRTGRHAFLGRAAWDSQPSRTSLFSALRQEDYRRTVPEIDEKEYISLRLIISELRNQYVSNLGPRPQVLWLLLVLVIVFLPLSGG